MDIYEIRKTNLIALIGNRVKRECADKWEMAPAHLSQVLSDKTKKNLGDDVARRIEDREGLPRGWLDVLQVDGQGFAQSNFAGLMDRVMVEGTKDVLRRHLEQALNLPTDDDAANAFRSISASRETIEMLLDQDLYGDKAAFEDAHYIAQTIQDKEHWDSVIRDDIAAVMTRFGELKENLHIFPTKTRLMTECIFSLIEEGFFVNDYGLDEAIGMLKYLDSVREHFGPRESAS